MYTDNDPNNWMEVSGGHGCPLFVAITCYSSTDFANWTFENNLLTQQPSGDLGHYRWVGRPKVIYNDMTEEYVMYMSIDDPCALLPQREGKVGVATCSTVNGNYTYLGSFNPLGDKVYDMTLFKDDDGKGYLITTGLNIYELTDDYLGVSSLTRTVRDSEAEAPAMFKTGGVYYLLCSKSTWWTSKPYRILSRPHRLNPDHRGKRRLWRKLSLHRRKSPRRKKGHLRLGRPDLLRLPIFFVWLSVSR